MPENTVYSECNLFQEGTQFNVSDLCGFETEMGDYGKCVATDSTCKRVTVANSLSNYEKNATCASHGCELSIKPPIGVNINDVDMTNAYCTDETYCSSADGTAALSKQQCFDHKECKWVEGLGCDKAKQFSSLTLRSDCGFLGMAGIFNLNEIDPSTFCGSGSYFNDTRNVCESVHSPDV